MAFAVARESAVRTYDRVPILFLIRNCMTQVRHVQRGYQPQGDKTPLNDSFHLVGFPCQVHVKKDKNYVNVTVVSCRLFVVSD